MPPVKKVVKKPAVSKSGFGQHLARYLQTKSMHDELTTRLKQQRDALIEVVVDHGVVDEKGHVWLQAPGVGIAKRELRSKNVFDEQFAEQWLKENGLWEQCSTTITVVDEDAVLARIYDATIPKDVEQRMYTTQAVYAFKVIDE
jgi:hypothetical protein